MSWGARALSKPIEAFISCMTSAGDMEKRPPHILLAFLSVTRLNLSVRAKVRGSRGKSEEMQSGKPVRHSGRSAIVTALGAAAIAAIAGFACVYVTLGRPDNGGGPPAAPAAPRGSQATRRFGGRGRPSAQPGPDGGFRISQRSRQKCQR